MAKRRHRNQILRGPEAMASWTGKIPQFRLGESAGFPDFPELPELPELQDLTPLPPKSPGWGDFILATLNAIASISLDRAASRSPALAQQLREMSQAFGPGGGPVVPVPVAEPTAAPTGGEDNVEALKAALQAEKERVAHLEERLDRASWELEKAKRNR